MAHMDEVKDRLAFMEIDQETVAALKAFRPVLEKELPGILDKFYAHLLKWSNLSAMFKTEHSQKQARNAQEAHWLRLFEAKFDADYVQSARRIGLVHSKIGLEPNWYLGAYAFTLNHLYALASRVYVSRINPRKAQAKTAALLRALNQCVIIDMDVVISVYLNENKRVYDERINALAGDFEKSVGAVVQSVAAASAELESSFESLVSMANQTSVSANSVAAAAEEASVNVAAVSSATEEMSASIKNVAQLANSSSLSSQQAVQEAEKSAGMMQELKETIDKISEVTNLITTIAEQTNLLALNATIEAARAGDVGKGFAVVASEVKSLATETARATEDIRGQISEILSKSDKAVRSIESVQKTINEVSEVSKGTAEAIEQQQGAVLEIAENVGQAALGTTDISSNVIQISQAAGETGRSANQAHSAVAELARQTDMLSGAVGKFLTEVRSGA